MTRNQIGMDRVLLGAAAVLLAVAPSLVHASWAYLPLQHRVLTADYIVIGEAVKELPAHNDPRGGSFDVLEIKVAKVLKGDPATKSLKLCFRAAAVGPGGQIIRHSGMIRYKKGQSGIWVLNAMPGTDYVTANYPGSCMPEDELSLIESTLKALDEEVKWGPAVEGVRLGLADGAFWELRPAGGGGQVQVRTRGNRPNPMIKVRAYIHNGSDKPIVIRNFRPDKPLSVTASGPVDDIDADPYFRFRNQEDEALPSAQPSDHHLLAVAPGQVVTVGLFDGALFLGRYPAPGEYNFVLHYRYQPAPTPDAPETPTPVVWQGKLSSGKVTINMDKSHFE